MDRKPLKCAIAHLVTPWPNGQIIFPTPNHSHQSWETTMIKGCETYVGCSKVRGSKPVRLSRLLIAANDNVLRKEASGPDHSGGDSEDSGNPLRMRDARGEASWNGLPYFEASITQLNAALFAAICLLLFVMCGLGGMGYFLDALFAKLVMWHSFALSRGV